MRDVAKVQSKYSLILLWLAWDLMAMNNKYFYVSISTQINNLTSQNSDNINVAQKFSANNLSRPKSTYK